MTIGEDNRAVPATGIPEGKQKYSQNCNNFLTVENFVEISLAGLLCEADCGSLHGVRAQRYTYSVRVSALGNIG